MKKDFAKQPFLVEIKKELTCPNCGRFRDAWGDCLPCEKVLFDMVNDLEDVEDDL